MHTITDHLDSESPTTDSAPLCAAGAQMLSNARFSSLDHVRLDRDFARQLGLSSDEQGQPHELARTLIKMGCCRHYYHLAISLRKLLGQAATLCQRL